MADSSVNHSHGGRLARVTPVLGNGPHQVICLHDWFGSSQGWGAMVDWLDGESFSYAFMDYRGYGNRVTEIGDFSVAEIASDVLALADGLGWEYFSLVGHAMGAMVMQRVLLSAPQRVHKMVGITPVPASGVPFDEATWEFFSSAVRSAEVRRAIMDLLTGNRLSGVWLEAMVRHSLATASPEAMGAYLSAWVSADFLPEVFGLQHPVQVLVGVHDPALTELLVRSTWMEAYPHAHIEIMPNAGHYPMFETPVALATTIERFLAE
jgi:pimeloyl-ACP methyl ester carboxylesterase